MTPINIGGYFQTFNDGNTIMFKKIDRFVTHYYLEGDMTTMENLMAKELAIYHPSGYSTSFTKNQDNSFTGFRYNSSD
jgi:hypothetical protein